MPGVKVHCALSKERTGFPFAELHRWVDMSARNPGVNHRKKRHYYNLRDHKTIQDYWDEKKGKGWGEKAVVEWLFHIAMDNLETAYKVSSKEESYGADAYNCIRVVFNPNGYIHCRFRSISGPPHRSTLTQLPRLEQPAPTGPCR